MPLEKDFPGLETQIRALRARGLQEHEIESAIAGHVNYLRQSGARGEAIDAMLHGRWSPLGMTLEAGMTPEGQKQLKDFNKSITVGTEETQDAFRRLARRRAEESQSSDGREGFIRGVMDSAAHSGSIFFNEIVGAGQQFNEGIRKAVSPSSTLLERALGAGAAGLAPLRALGAPFTAVTRPVAEQGAKQLGLGDIGETYLEAGLNAVMPGVGLIGMRPPNLLAKEAENIHRASTQFPQFMSPTARGPLPEAEIGMRPQLALPPAPLGAMRSQPYPMPGDILPPGTNVPPYRGKPPIQMPDESIPSSTPMRKIETPEGPATVVATTPKETIVTKLPEDQGFAAAKHSQDIIDTFQEKRGEQVFADRIQEGMKETGMTAEQFTRTLTPEEAARSSAVVREAKRRGLVDERGFTGTPEQLEEIKSSLTQAPEGFSPEQAKIVAAHRIARAQNISREEALQRAEGLSEGQLNMMAAQELRDFRISTGELTGKPGRPKKPEALQLGEQRLIRGMPVETMEPEALRQSLRKGKVQLPSRESIEGAGLVPISTVRKLADQRGYDLQMKPGGKVHLVKNGGEVEQFDSLRDANAFMLTKDVKPKQPIELLSPATDQSGFEAAMEGKQLTGEQQQNLAKQRELVSKQKPLEGQGGDLPRTEVTQPVRKIELAPNQKLGTIEDIKTRPEALKEFRRIREAGYQARMIQTKDGGFEVAFFRSLDPETTRALALHKMYLNRGAKALTEGEHEALGRAFGIGDAEITQYLKDFKTGGETPRSLGAAAPSDVAAAGPVGRTPWYLRAGAAASVNVPSGGALRWANPMAGGLNSGSPLIRQLTSDVMKGELAYDFRMKGFQQLLSKAAELVGGGKGTAAAKRAFDLKEGTIQPSSERDREFLNLANSITQDFARRARDAGMLKEAQQLENYAPHVTDMQAVWKTFRDHFVEINRYEDLDAGLKAKLTPAQFERFHEAFVKNPDVNKVPKDTLRQIRDKVFDWSDIASDARSLPDWAKDKLPDEVFQKFMLPRSGKVPAVPDFFNAMEQYIGRVEFGLNFDPILQKYKPIVESLPGGGVVFTERGMAEKILDNAIIRKPTWDQAITKAVGDRVNTILGKELFRLDDLNAGAQLIRNGWFRGALGPDTAILHATQAMTTWAETGRLIGPLFKYITKGSRDIPAGVFTEFTRTFGPEVTSDRKGLQKLLEVDKKLTQFVLSPHQLVENVMRGIEFYAGLEEAIAKGVSSDKVIPVGFARASNVVPNLALSEAHMKALEMSIRLSRGFSPGTMAPLLVGRSPLGRLSTMLLSFPGHTIQLFQRSLRSGFSDAMLKSEPGKLLRWTALTGFWVGLPLVAAEMGVDLRRFFQQHVMADLTGFPMFKMLYNGIQAVKGEPAAKDRAKQQAWEGLLQTLVPGYRYGGKVKKTFENIERGYAVDQRNRFLYNTTPYGEIMNLIGVPMEEAFDARQSSRKLRELSQQYVIDKQKTIDGFLNGQTDMLAEFYSNWGRQIDMQDIQKALQNRMTTPQQRAVRSMPRDLQQKYLQEYGQMPQQSAGGERRRRELRW